MCGNRKPTGHENDGNRQERQQGQLPVDDEQRNQHGGRQGNSNDGFGDAVGDEVLDRFHVAHGTRHQRAHAPVGEEAVGQRLDVAVEVDHHGLLHVVGRPVGEQAVGVPSGGADQVGAHQGRHHDQHGVLGGGAFGVPDQDLADEQRWHQPAGREEQASRDRADEHAALGAGEA